jgi:hypothetical protein
MVVIPDLPIPFPPKINPATDDAERHVRSYLRDVGLLRSPEAMFHYDQTRFGELVGRAYPNADPEGLALITDWMAVWAIFDDQLEKIPDDCSSAAFDSLAEALLSWLDLGGDGVLTDLANPLEVAFLDIWRRIRARSSPAWQARFVRHVADYLGGCRWEAANRRSGRTPPLEDYIETRRRFGGMKPSMDLTELGGRFELSAGLHAHPRTQELLAATADLVLWANDIFSVEAELADGNMNNIVLVYRHERGCTLQNAVDAVAGMLAVRVTEFEALTADLPTADPHSEYAKEGDALAAYVTGMWTWIRGNVDWSRGNERYRSAHHRVSEKQPNYLKESLKS